MNIQDSFNAMLASGALLYRMSPQYDYNKIKVAEKGQAKYNQELMNKLKQGGDTPNNAVMNLLAEGSNKLGEIQRDKALAKPSTKNVDAAVETKEMSYRANEVVDAFNEAKDKQKGLEALNSLKNITDNNRNSKHAMENRVHMMSSKKVNKAIDDAFKNAFKDNDGGKK